MKTYPGIDYDQRPASYFDDSDPLTAILRNVQGTERRAMIRACWESGELEELDDALLTEKLGKDLRRRLGRIDPCFMGGEYLPSYRPEEREIARIELQSTTRDVISIRARPSGRIRRRIHYRVVDEYRNTFIVKPKFSVQPLTLRELIGLFENSGHPELPGPLSTGYNECLADDKDSRLELRDFTQISSDLYPQLSDHYEQVFDDWVREGEKAVDASDRSAEPDER